MKPLPTLALCLTLACLPAYAADEPSQLKDVPQLIRSGKLDEATRLVDKALAANPKNAAARFQRSAVLTARGKPDEAIAILLELTAEYPELPEPYNNLAVLYADAGEYDKALGALDQALRNNPSYATAHENLGDVYAALAAQSYGRALKLEPSNVTVPPKLALIRQLYKRGGGASAKAAAAIASAASAP
jgi:tetratricopeptide (TPR) repeat protein